MSNLRDFAEQELNLIVEHAQEDDRPIIEEFIPEILALIDKIGNSGQSGGSMPYTANAIANTIKKLCFMEPLSPIYGNDDEWTDVSEYSDGPLWQNKRCSALFKQEDGRVKYVDALVKRTQNNTTWTGSFWVNRQDYLNGNRELKIGNTQYIRGFPFEPKTFYIDVIEEEVREDDWEMFLANINQLEEAFEYYERPATTRRVLIEKNNTFLL